MPRIQLDNATPNDLIPRMGNLPVSNARYFRSAIITRITEPNPDPKEVPLWSLFGSVKHAQDSGGRDVEITAIAYSPDAHKIASADSSGVIRIWNSSSLQPHLHPLSGHTGGVTSIAFNADGSLLVSADVIGAVRIWDVATGRHVHESSNGFSTLSASLAVDRQGRILAGPTDGAYALFDFTTDSPVKVEALMPAQAEEFTTIHTVFTAQGVQMVGGSKEGSVGFWHKGGSGVVVQGVGRHSGQVACVALSPDGVIGASGGADGNLRFWRPTTGEAIETVRPVGTPWHGRTVRALAFSPDGALIVSASDDGTVRMWNREGFQINNPMTSSPDRFTAIAFSPNSAQFAAGGNDGSFTVWFDATHAIRSPLALPKPAEASATSASRPAVGVLLTHQQSWTMEGIALGELLHSVSLAPGEITQLAVNNHTQRVMENSADTVSQSEDLSQRGLSSSALSETEHATADEQNVGVSFGTSFGTSSGGGLGGGLGLLGVSGGAAVSGSVATNVSVSSGTRHVSDESTQAVHQHTKQAARMARSRFSASIREVSESDTQELNTRVLANYNHMHALTMQYYEVVQVQRLTTAVTDAHRLIFVPMRAIDFRNDEQARTALSRYPHEIAATLRTLGFYGAATCVDHLMVGYNGGTKLRQQRLDALWIEVDRLQKDLDTLTQDKQGTPSELTQARTRAEAASDAVLKARDNLRKAKDVDLAERAGLQRILAAAMEEEDAATDHLNQLRLKSANLQKRLAEGKRLKQELAALIGTSQPSGPPAPTGLQVNKGAPASPSSPDAVPNTSAPTIDARTLKELESRVYKLLIDHQLTINHGLWMRLDPTLYASLLAGTTFEGEPLAKAVDPTPVAVFGNYVAFRWHHADPLEAARFRYEYVHTAQSYQETIALHTGGVFGEAVLGEANAADKIDITRFWNWKDALPPIRPAAIDPLQQSEETPLTTPTLPTAPTSALDLGPITFPEVSSGLVNIIDALKNPDLFRDLSGSKTTAALAQSALQLTSESAGETAQLASKNFQRHLQLQQKIADAALNAISSRGNTNFDPTMAGAILNSKADSPSATSGVPDPSQPGVSGKPAAGGSASARDANEDTTKISFEPHEPAGVPVTATTNTGNTQGGETP